MNIRLWHLIIPFAIISFSSYAQIDVNLVTGEVNSSIPVASVSSKSLTYPIVLNYTSNGIKIGEPAGNCGMGWNLNTGGQVTRVVRGLPDEINTTSKKGWLFGGSLKVKNFNPTADENYSIATDEYNDYTYLNQFGGFDDIKVIYDSEPDVFYFSAPGLNGMFVFDENGEIVFNSNNNITINVFYDAQGLINGFNLISINGSEYSFLVNNLVSVKTEKLNDFNEELVIQDRRNYFNYEDSVVYSDSWILSRMTALDGGKIDFNYKKVNSNNVFGFHNNTFSTLSHDTVYTNSYNRTENKYQKVAQFWYKYHRTSATELVGIHGENNRVEIVRGNHNIPVQFHPDVTKRRHPSNQPNTLIDKVKFYTSNGNGEFLAKETNFNYEFLHSFDYVPKDSIKSIYPFLMSVEESFENYDAQPLIFDYYNINLNDKQVFLPQHFSFSTDYFGYANANSGSQRFKEIYIYPEENAQNRYRPYPINDYDKPYYKLVGSSNNPDEWRLQAGVLKSMRLKTGGSVFVDYEVNTYVDDINQIEQYGGGLRVKAITLHDGINYDNDIIKEYSYSKGRLVHKPQYDYTTDLVYDFTAGKATSLSNYNAVNNQEDPNTIWKLKTIRSETDMAGDVLNGGPHILYENVKISTPNQGYIFYEYNIPIWYGESFQPDWQPSKLRLAREKLIGDSHTGNIPDLIFSFNDIQIQQSSFSKFNGLLKQVSEISNEGDSVGVTEYNYIFPSNSTVVKGLKLHKQPIVTQSGVSRQMHIYGKYDLIMNAVPQIIKTVRRDFEGIKSVENTSKYFFDTNFEFLIRAEKTDPEGRIYKSYTTYNHQLTESLLNIEDAPVHLKRMALLGIKGLPVEEYTTLTEPGRTEQMISANFIDYSFLPGNKIIPQSSWKLRELVSRSAFNPISINIVNQTIIKDNSYEKVQEVMASDLYENIATVKSYPNQISTTLFSQNGTIPILNASDVSLEGISYNNFEQASVNVLQENSHELEFLTNHANSLVAGRIAGKALKLKLGTSNGLSRQFVKSGEHQTYIVSFWYKAISTEQLNIEFDDSSLLISKSINLSVSNEWKYIEFESNVDNLGNQFNFKLFRSTGTQDLIIDDLIVFPSNAIFSYDTYDDKLLKRGSTNHLGISTYFEYDYAKRPTTVRDFNNNIVSYQEYKELPYNGKRAPLILYNGEVITATPITFKTKHTGDVQNSTFYWKVLPHNSAIDANDDTNYSGAVIANGFNTYDHTFIAPGEYLILCKVVTPDKALYLSSRVNVNENIQMDLCVSGITAYDHCNDDYPTASKVACGSVASPGSTIFKPETTGLAGDITYKWYWYFGSTSVNFSPGYFEPQTPQHIGPTYSFNKEDSNKDVTIVCVAYSSLEPDRARVSSHQFIDYYWSNPLCGGIE